MAENSDKLLAGISGSTGILLSTLWNQSGYIKINGASTGYQYNEYCPMDYSTGKRSITGCTNTAAAQIIHYYIEKFGLELQLTLSAGDVYESNYNGNTISITESGSSAGTISFSQVNGYLSYYDPTSGQDIAALNYACGVVQEAGYSSSATSTAWSADLFFRAGFDSVNTASMYNTSNVYWGSQGNITAAGFEVLIENLTAGKVVGTSYPGHALIIDGYNASDDTFHINFGWGNSSSTRWYTRAEMNTREYYYFLYDLGVDSDYSYTVNDTDVYGTGTLVRAVELANGAKGENLIKFSSVTNNKNLTLPNYISFSDDTRISGFNMNLAVSNTTCGWYSGTSASVSYENFTGTTIVKNSSFSNAIEAHNTLYFEGNGALIYSGNTTYSSSYIQSWLETSQMYGWSASDWILNNGLSYSFYALSENDKITLTNKSYVAGHITLGSGDDYLAITGGSHLYGNVNPGSGSDTIIADSSSTVEGTLYNYANISFELNEINSNQAIWATDSLYNFYCYADLSIDIYNAKSGVYSLVSASSNTSYLNRMSFTITGSGFADYNLSCNGTNSSNGTELFIENNTLKLRVNKFSSSDVTAPGTPYYSTNHTSHDQVTISWDKSTDNVATHHYQLRYGQSSTLSGNGITTKETEIKLSGLAAGQYYYQLSAVDASGNASGWSGVKSFSIMSENTDLKIYDHEVSATDILTTQSVTLTFKVKNFGYKKAGDSTVAIYDGTSKKIGELSIYSLISGGYHTCTYTIAANTLSEGTHKIYLVADSKKTVTEDNENNNQVSLTIKATMPKADLYVKSFSVNADCYKSTDSVKFTFQVANSGNAASTATKASFYDGTSKKIGEITIDSIAVNGYKTYTFTAAAGKISAGNRTIYVALDPANTVREFNDNNNQKSLAITMNKPGYAPDLYIKNYSTNAICINSSDTVKLTFQVANQGNALSTASKVGIYVGSSTKLGEVAIDPVYPNGYKTYTYTISKNKLAAGDHKIYFVTDLGNKVHESNENNNQKSLTIKVNQNGYTPDLYIRSYSASATCVNASDSIKLTFQVGNSGSALTTAAKVGIYDGTSTKLGEVTIDPVYPSGYKTYTYTIAGNKLAAGNHNFYFVADLHNVIRETNENNNQKSVAVKVNPAGYTPDLYIKSYSTNATCISKSDSVKLTFQVANNGNTASTATNVAIYDGTTTKIAEVAIDALSAGASKTYSYTIAGSKLTAGSHKFYFVTDLANKVHESNENNNQKSLSVMVNQTGYAPDLYVESFTLTKTYLSANEPVSFILKASNSGNAASTATKIAIYDGPSTKIKEITLQAVAAKSSNQLKVTLDGIKLSAGTHKLYAVLDPANIIRESNESNNQKSQTVTIAEAAKALQSATPVLAELNAAPEALDLAPAELSGGFDLAGTDTLSSVVPSAQMASLSSESLFTETDDRNKMLLNLA